MCIKTSIEDCFGGECGGECGVECHTRDENKIDLRFSPCPEHISQKKTKNTLATRIPIYLSTRIPTSQLAYRSKNRFDRHT